MAHATGFRNEIRVILLGKTGTGKSSFGNTILGASRFLEGMSPNSITEHCACYPRDLDGRQVFVVDTPGFCDTRVDAEESIQKEVAKAYQATALPGPHAFLLTIEPRRFTPEEARAVGHLSSIFGSDAFKHTIIVFTHGDSFNPKKCTIESYLKMLEPQSALKLLLDQCDWRYLVVNNEGTEMEKAKVVKTLIDMITKMTVKNNGQVYRTTKFDEVARVNDEERAKGAFSPINVDGSIILHPKIEKIIVDSFLRRSIGRRVVQ